MKRICCEIISEKTPGTLRPYATSFATGDGDDKATGPIVYGRSLAR